MLLTRSTNVSAFLSGSPRVVDGSSYRRKHFLPLGSYIDLREVKLSAEDDKRMPSVVTCQLLLFSVPKDNAEFELLTRLQLIDLDSFFTHQPLYRILPSH